MKKSLILMVICAALFVTGCSQSENQGNHSQMGQGEVSSENMNTGNDNNMKSPEVDDMKNKENDNVPDASVEDSTVNPADYKDVQLSESEMEQELAKECMKEDTDLVMTYGEAVEIAEKSACAKEGTLMWEHSCNAETGTWWLDLATEKRGCNPACVISIENKTAEINWRCIGAKPE